LFAPVLLLFARLLQGLSVGGEYGTSATYLSEVATKERRGFYSSFQYVTLIGGQLLALGIQVLLQQVFLTTVQLEQWGWRVPFIIGALLAFVAFYLRRHMEESYSFKEVSVTKEDKGSLKTLIKIIPVPC
jgi:MHS family alpha-ketoglutarate permease-like MFS transporter